MALSSSNIETVHPDQTFQTQTNSVTAALPNGGYVVAWNDNFGTTGFDVKFQRYDGFGNAVGPCRPPTTRWRQIRSSATWK